MILDKDTFSIVQSYFELEDILNLYENNIPERDKLIQKYYTKLPEFREVLEKGHLKSGVYLSQRIKIDIRDIDIISKVDNLEIFKIFLQRCIEDDIQKDPHTGDLEICDAFYAGLRSEIMDQDAINCYKYINHVWQTDESDLSHDFQEALVFSANKIMKYLYQKIKLSEDEIQDLIVPEYRNDELTIIKNLQSLGYQFNKSDLDYASSYGELEIVKYLISLGLQADKATFIRGMEYADLRYIKEMISLGITPDEDALNYSVGCKYGEITQYLLSLDIKPNQKTYQLIGEKGYPKYIKNLF